MKNEIISYYLKCFTNLKRARNNGGAPHKPILLLSLISLFNQNLFSKREIKITPEFVAYFNSNWNRLVETNHQSNFAMPFYHMQSEPFWKLIPNIGCEKWIASKSSMRSFKNLTTAVSYAIIDKELVELLLNPESRDILKIALLEKYFPKNTKDYSSDNDDLPSSSLLHEDSESYRRKILGLKNVLDENKFQEEVFVRSGIFKREIPKIYNNTCAISNLRIDSLSTASMIDACHIIPFSENYDDTISNGIALCPNLHRAFDRGLIAISNDYKVIINKNFIESGTSPYSLKQFENNTIRLPESIECYPSLNNFAIHRQRFNF